MDDTDQDLEFVVERERCKEAIENKVSQPLESEFSIMKIEFPMFVVELLHQSSIVGKKRLAFESSP